MNLEDNFLDKYNAILLKNINKENRNKIIQYLALKGVYFIDEIIENYLDIFLIEYDTFVIKFENLQNKYGNQFVNELGNNLSILEELLK